MTEQTVRPNTEGKEPFVISFSYTEKLVGQMLVWATSEEALEDEVVKEFRSFVPDFTIVEAEQITKEEGYKIMEQLDQRPQEKAH
jgi:hypothetical protein